MKLNEKGFTYPLVMLLIVFFCFFLTYQIQLSLAEKRFFHESVVILRQEYFMHNVVKKIETSLQNNSLSIGTGQFEFQNGMAFYRIESYSSNLDKITITIKLGTLQEMICYAYYDKTQQKITKWVERN